MLCYPEQTCLSTLLASVRFGVAGVTGVTGRNLALHLIKSSKWKKVYGASRRGTNIDEAGNSIKYCCCGLFFLVKFLTW
jgi:hypothetical protein